MALTDATTNRTYYFNSSSGLSQWECPVGDASTGAGVSTTAATATHQLVSSAVPVQLEALQRLPAGWEEMKDMATNRTYFAHRATGVTQWEMPR